MYNRRDLRWDGHRLRLRSGRLFATIVADPDWDGMWRVRLPNGGNAIPLMCWEVL
jgi:hypothetical protein